MHNTLRPAIAMIELIFAIAVLGIALLSVPNLLSVSSKSTLVMLQQEAIAMAASHTNALMTYPWDEQNTDKYTYVTQKLNVAAGNALWDAATIMPILTFPAARSRNFAGGINASDTLGTEVNATDDDMDDYNGINTNTVLAIAGASSYATDEGEYVDVNISQNTTVSYGADDATYNSGTGVFTFPDPYAAGAPGGTTNIKLITTVLTSNTAVAELNKTIKLKAFMCNIGANKPNTLGGF